MYCLKFGRMLCDTPARVTPVPLYAFDAETGHKMAVGVLRSGAVPCDLIKDDIPVTG